MIWFPVKSPTSSPSSGPPGIVMQMLHCTTPWGAIQISVYVKSAPWRCSVNSLHGGPVCPLSSLFVKIHIRWPPFTSGYIVIYLRLTLTTLILIDTWVA